MNNMASVVLRSVAGHEAYHNNNNSGRSGYCGLYAATSSCDSPTGVRDARRELDRCPTGSAS